MRGMNGDDPRPGRGCAVEVEEGEKQFEIQATKVSNAEIPEEGGRGKPRRKMSCAHPKRKEEGAIYLFFGMRRWELSVMPPRTREGRETRTERKKEAPMKQKVSGRAGRLSS